MVCDEMWKGEMLRTLYMIGVFLGGGIFGVIGDRFVQRKNDIISEGYNFYVKGMEGVNLF